METFELLGPMLTYKDVAKILKVSERTVQTLYYEGKLKGIKVGKRNVRFTNDWIRNYIAELHEVCTLQRI
jgi:excisionase family DNA binding protein